LRRTTLFFVRHGVTAHTGHKLSGLMEGIDLTEEGRAQAAATAESLTKVKFKALYSSPLERCYQTAKIIGERLSLEVESTEQLGEVDYGKWTNRTMRSLMKTKLWEVVQRQPSAVRFPEGETLRDVQARSVNEVERLAAKHRGQVICCVTHADVIRVVFAHYLGVHLDLYQRLMVGPASVSVLSLGEGGPRVWSLNSAPRSE
jgi:probable phosphoglycerate mutase